MNEIEAKLKQVREDIEELKKLQNWKIEEREKKFFLDGEEYGIIKGVEMARKEILEWLKELKINCFSGQDYFNKIIDKERKIKQSLGEKK